MTPLDRSSLPDMVHVFFFSPLLVSVAQWCLLVLSLSHELLVPPARQQCPSMYSLVSISSPPRITTRYLPALFSLGTTGGGGTQRGGTLNPRKSVISRWGHKLGHTVGGGGGGGGEGGGRGGGGGGGTEATGRAGEGGEDGDDPPALLGAITIDRVVEQLFFVRVSVYNAKGKLSEAQQVTVLQGVGAKFCTSAHQYIETTYIHNVWAFGEGNSCNTAGKGLVAGIGRSIRGVYFEVIYPSPSYTISSISDK